MGEQSSTADINAVVRDALQTAKEKQRVCREKRWTLTFRGKEILLQDKADKVVEWLDHFKDIGDVAANADPVHIGLPWAGVRVLLKVCFWPVKFHDTIRELIANSHLGRGRGERKNGRASYGS